MHILLLLFSALNVHAADGPCEVALVTTSIPRITFVPAIHHSAAAPTIAPAAQVELAAKFIEYTRDNVTFLENRKRADEDPQLERFDELLLLAERGDGVASADILNTLYETLRSKLESYAEARAKHGRADDDRFAWEDVSNTRGRAPLLAKLARVGFAALDLGHRAEGETILRYCVHEFTTVHQPALHLPSASLLLRELVKRREEALTRELLPAIGRAAAEAPHLVARAVLQVLRYRHKLDAAGDRALEDFLARARGRFVGSDQILAELRKIHARGGLAPKKDEGHAVEWTDLEGDFIDVESKIIDTPWSSVSTTVTLVQTGRDLRTFDPARGDALIQIARVLAQATFDLSDRAPLASIRSYELRSRGKLKYDPVLGPEAFYKQLILDSTRDHFRLGEDRIRKYAYGEFVPDADLRDVATEHLLKSRPNVALLEVYPEIADTLDPEDTRGRLAFSRRWQHAAASVAREVIDHRFGYEPEESTFMKHQLIRLGVNERAPTDDYEKLYLYNRHLLLNAKFLSRHATPDVERRIHGLYDAIDGALGDGFNVHDFETRRGKDGSVLHASRYDGRLMKLRAAVELTEVLPVAHPLAATLLSNASRLTHALARDPVEDLEQYVEEHERVSVDLNLLRQLYRHGRPAEAEALRRELLRFVAKVETELHAEGEPDGMDKFDWTADLGKVTAWRRALEVDAPTWAIESLVRAGAFAPAREAAHGLLDDAERNLQLGRDRFSGERLIAFAKILGERASTRALAGQTFELAGRYLARERGGEDWSHRALSNAHHAVMNASLTPKTRDRLIAGYLTLLWPEQMTGDSNTRDVDLLLKLVDEILGETALPRAQKVLLERLAGAVRDHALDHDGMSAYYAFKMMTPMMRAVTRFNPALLREPDPGAARALARTAAGRVALQRVYPAHRGATEDLGEIAERLRAQTYDVELAHRQLMAYLERVKTEARPRMTDAYAVADLLVENFAFLLHARTKTEYHAGDDVATAPLIADLARLGDAFTNADAGRELWMILLKERGNDALRALHKAVLRDEAAPLARRERAFLTLRATYGKAAIAFYDDRIKPLGDDARKNFFDLEALLYFSPHFSEKSPRLRAFIVSYPERMPELTARVRRANAAQPLRFDLLEPLDWLLAELASKSDQYLSAFELYYFTRARFESGGKLTALVDAAGVERRAREYDPTFALTAEERAQIDARLRKDDDYWGPRALPNFGPTRLKPFQSDALDAFVKIAGRPREVAKYFDGDELTNDEIQRLAPPLHELMALRSESAPRAAKIEMPGWMNVLPARVRLAATEFFTLLPYGERAEILANDRGAAPGDAPKAVRHFFEMTNLGKFGQFLSTQIDRVPAAYREELVHFQENGEGSSPAEIEQTLVSELGHPAADLFADFTPRALNVGTVGEVFAARLKDGRDVIVKILTPSRRRALLQMLTRAERLTQRLEPKPEFDETGWDVRSLYGAFDKNLRAEMDFKIELGHGQLLSRFLPTGATVPAYVPELTTTSVLVQERARGVAIGEVEDADVRADLERRVGQIFLEQVQKTGVVHADLHPGNYRVPKDGVGDIELLDAGRIIELGPDARARHVALAMAVQLGSVEAVVTALGRDPKTLPPETRAALGEALSRPDPLARAMETVFVARQRGLEVPANVIELLEASSKCFGRSPR